MQRDPESISGFKTLWQKSVLKKEEGHSLPMSAPGLEGEANAMSLKKTIPPPPHLCKVRPQCCCSVAQKAVCVLSEFAEVQCKAL
jgi:hypothetical protein